jgi:hypothetical protein
MRTEWLLVAAVSTSALACGGRSTLDDQTLEDAGAADASVTSNGSGEGSTYVVPCSTSGDLPCGGALMGAPDGYYLKESITTDGGGSSCECVPESQSPGCSKFETTGCTCTVCGPDPLLQTESCEFNSYNGLPVEIVCRLD